jgi:hypothetical protein
MPAHRAVQRQIVQERVLAIRSPDRIEIQPRLRRLLASLKGLLAFDRELDRLSEQIRSTRIDQDLGQRQQNVVVWATAFDLQWRSQIIAIGGPGSIDRVDPGDFIGVR